VVDVPNVFTAAVSLGGRPGYSKIAGYLTAAPSSGVGPEKLEYYQFKVGPDGASDISNFAPATQTGVLAYLSNDGLTVGSRLSVFAVKFDFYPTGTYLQAVDPVTGLGFTPNAGALPKRTTTITRLTAGAPSANHVLGYQLKLAEAGRAVRVQTTWTSGPAQAVLGKVYSHSTHSLETPAGVPLVGSVQYVAESTRAVTPPWVPPAPQPPPPLDRVILLTTTEVIPQPAYSGGAATSTITTCSSEVRRAFAWGEDTIAQTVHLGPSFASPGWTSTTA
jgi:hypothetical protein